MEAVLYILARSVIGLLQCLPLRMVARLGRLGGGIAYGIDARHRRVALDNLKRCFGSQKSDLEIRELAKENFRRIGENFACAMKMAFMSKDQARNHYELVKTAGLATPSFGDANSNRIIAIGHFGNFELYTHLAEALPGFQGATTYRGLRHPSLDRLLHSMRVRSGCLFFERRSDAPALKAAMTAGRVMLGLLADQHGGRRGLVLPLFGRDCSTNAAPALFALRYKAPLFTAICFRTGLARWRIEVGDEVPIYENGSPRSPEAIMADINAAFESAIRRDPANWFWVHNRWKLTPGRGRKRRLVESEIQNHDLSPLTDAEREFPVSAESHQP